MSLLHSLKLTAIAPENRPLEKEIPSLVSPPFLGAILVSGRVGFQGFVLIVIRKKLVEPGSLQITECLISVAVVVLANTRKINTASVMRKMFDKKP